MNALPTCHAIVRPQPFILCSRASILCSRAFILPSPPFIRLQDHASAHLLPLTYSSGAALIHPTPYLSIQRRTSSSHAIVSPQPAALLSSSQGIVLFIPRHCSPHPVSSTIPSMPYNTPILYLSSQSFSSHVPLDAPQRSTETYTTPSQCKSMQLVLTESR